MTNTTNLAGLNSFNNTYTKNTTFSIQWDKVKFPYLLYKIEESYPSLNKFCHKAGISNASLHLILYGKIAPSRKMMIKIAQLLGKDSAELFSRQKEVTGDD